MEFGLDRVSDGQIASRSRLQNLYDPDQHSAGELRSQSVLRSAWRDAQLNEPRHTRPQ